MADGLLFPGNATMLACGWLGEIVYLLPPRQEVLPVFFMGDSFCFLLQNAEAVTQQKRNCPCKTKTATTGRQPVEKINKDYQTFVSFIIFCI